MINRRRFLQTLAAAATAPACDVAVAKSGELAGFGPLVADPDGLLDLPAGFSHSIVARLGQQMDDGLRVPGMADGMAAFPGADGEVILVCNHENNPFNLRNSPFGRRRRRLKSVDRTKIYDRGENQTPALGGTTTIHYDPATKQRTHMHMSLLGTEINCAGGATPWGSWLSCEESFTSPGTSFEGNTIVRRERRHGYVFEVPAADMEPVTPVPLTDMGRFEHEAAAVNPQSGYIYLTEDRHESLLYRFIPHVPGKLHEGGRLQALAFQDRQRADTRNWLRSQRIVEGEDYPVTWIDLEDVDSDRDDLRFRGHEKGAAVFARGEGLCYADGVIAITATIGGAHRLGQVFTYRPSPLEGSGNEDDRPGSLRLFAESTSDSLLRNADNLTLSPWGDLIVCEDTASHCGLVGIRPDGRQYALADNAYTTSELAGICFSPDGQVMFVNIQASGTTLAITGPWEQRFS